MSPLAHGVSPISSMTTLSPPRSPLVSLATCVSAHYHIYMYIPHHSRVRDTFRLHMHQFLVSYVTPIPSQACFLPVADLRRFCFNRHSGSSPHFLEFITPRIANYNSRCDCVIRIPLGPGDARLSLGFNSFGPTCSSQVKPRIELRQYLEPGPQPPKPAHLLPGTLRRFHHPSSSNATCVFLLKWI
jgi:hypothetical protein